MENAKREIVLCQILESDKKIELFVEIDNSQKVSYVESKQGDIFSYKSAIIKSIRFILNSNKVLSIRVELESISSGYGLKLSELFKSGYELQLLEETDLKDNVSGFYFVIPNQ